MKTLYAAVIAIMISSCANNHHNSDKINIAEAMENPVKELALQDLFTNIEYVPLETTDSSIIGKNPDIKVLDKFILVFSDKMNLKLFDRKTGKYIREIGHIGNDPKGYSNHGYWVDDSQKIIYFAGWNNDLISYDLDGNFKGEIDLKDKENKLVNGSYFLIDSNGIWGHYKLNLISNISSVFNIDKQTLAKSEVVSWKAPAISMDQIQSMSIIKDQDITYGGDAVIATITGNKKSISVVNSPSLWKSGDKIRLKQAFNDTIYTVSKKGITPYKIFELGKWHWNQDEQLDIKASENKLSIDYVLENDKYIYFHLQKNLLNSKAGQSYCGFYNKKTEEIRIVKGDELLDKVNNQNIQISSICPDGSFISITYPDKLSESKQKQMQIKEDDNPIIVIIN